MKEILGKIKDTAEAANALKELFGKEPDKKEHDVVNNLDQKLESGRDINMNITQKIELDSCDHRRKDDDLDKDDKDEK